MIMIYYELGACRVSLVSPDYYDTKKQRKMRYSTADAMRHQST